MKLALTSIFVSEPTEAFDFYVDVLDFYEVMQDPENDLAIVSPEEDGPAILLEPITTDYVQEFKDGLYREELPCIVLEAEDVQAEYKRLSKAGVQFLQKPTENEWGVEAIFDDGFGNYLQIHQSE